MLNAKHSGTVEGERSLVPTAFPPISYSLGHRVGQRKTGARTPRSKVFSSSRIIMIRAMQMKPLILLVSFVGNFRTGTFGVLKKG